MSVVQAISLNDCVSDEEKKQRLGVTLINVIVWIGLACLVVSSMGVLLVVFLFGWLLNHLLAEYNVRSLEALGSTVSPRQLPEVHQAAQEVCQRFGLKTMPRIVVINSGESNAFALRFARQKVVLILSELLEGIVDNPAQLRFLIAHEACHGVLDQGGRGTFEIYKPARYRQARELTCDNAGLVAAGDLQQSKEILKKLCIGHKLHTRLSEETLIADAARINSGIVGWLLRQYLSHPPAGARLRNVTQFQTRRGAVGLAAPSAQQAVLPSPVPPAFDTTPAISEQPLSPVPPAQPSLPPMAPAKPEAPKDKASW